MPQIFGEAVIGNLGVDRAGWMEDWALVRVRQGYKSDNRLWWGREEKDRVFAQRFMTLEHGIMDAGYTWLKDGAATGRTEVVSNGNALEFFGFSRPVVKTLALLSSSKTGEATPPPALPGDAGAAILHLFPGIGGDAAVAAFGGMVVAVFVPTKRYWPKFVA